MPVCSRQRGTVPTGRQADDCGKNGGRLQGEDGNPFEKGFSPLPPAPPIPFPETFSTGEEQEQQARNVQKKAAGRPCDEAEDWIP